MVKCHIDRRGWKVFTRTYRVGLKPCFCANVIHAWILRFHGDTLNFFSFFYRSIFSIEWTRVCLYPVKQGICKSWKNFTYSLITKIQQVRYAIDEYQKQALIKVYNIFVSDKTKPAKKSIPYPHKQTLHKNFTTSILEARYKVTSFRANHDMIKQYKFAIVSF
jgi:hypothetical protein